MIYQFTSNEDLSKSDPTCLDCGLRSNLAWVEGKDRFDLYENGEPHWCTQAETYVKKLLGV
jgi:hypothetical protein